MIEYQMVVGGEAHGPLLVLDEPLSFWGGVDPQTGWVIDVNHPQVGVSLAGHIVAMPHGRGSSSASAVLAETMANGTAPAGFVLNEIDPILMVGSLVGRHLYGVPCPILVGPTPSRSGRMHRIREGRLIEEIE